MSATGLAVEFKNISKSFGEIRVLDNASFQIRPGTIHALLGENGAGKSTLMKILFGIYQADAGQILLNGKPVAFESSLQAREAGLGMVHQHFLLAEPISAMDHLILEDSSLDRSWTSFFKPISKKHWLNKLNTVSQNFALAVDWKKPISQLPVGIQQRIEIIKLLSTKASVLIFDEPTAVLTPQETDAFLKRLVELKQKGYCIILITHKLKEVLRVGDDFSVLRKGRIIQSGSLQGQTAESLGMLMVGKLPEALEQRATQNQNKKAILEIKNLSLSSGQLQNLNLSVFAGEILGLAGVEGNGQQEVISLLTNPGQFKYNGELFLKNQNLQKSQNRQLRELGLVSLSEDRLKSGILPTQSVLWNFLLGKHWLKKFTRFGFFKMSMVRESVQNLMQSFNVQPSNFNLPMEKFSGGNQQKFVVAKELEGSPQLMVACHPTRGVDFAAAAEIQRELVKMRNRGGSVILISSDLEEIIKISDRVVVLFQGHIKTEFAGKDLSEEKLGAAMGGA